MQTLMYVEVWNIMVCIQNVPDPNKHEQTPDVVRGRPWRSLDFWENIVDRRERRRHSHAHTHADTHTHMCTHTDTWHSHTQKRTRRRTHARADTRADTHAYTHAHTRVHTHSHTPEQTRTHAHALTQTHTRHAHTHKHTRIHTRHTRRAGNGGNSGGWAEERKRRDMRYGESISAHTEITSTEYSRHDVHSRCMRNESAWSMAHACTWTSRFVDVTCVVWYVYATMRIEQSRAGSRGFYVDHPE